MSKWLRIVVWVFGVIACLALGLETFARVPGSFAVPALAPGPDTRVLAVLVHGTGGREEPTLMALEQRFAELAAGQPGTTVIRYIWSPFSDTRFRARVNGERVGTALGREVAGMRNIQVIHLVGHSAGAYPLDSFCRAYREAAAQPARLVMTFLDPIGFDGMFNPGWGVGNFGGCADYAEAVINTDDPVPATNEPLQQAWNVDITGAASRAGTAADGHRWPVQYYLEQVTAADVDGASYSHTGRPRGTVVRR